MKMMKLALLGGAALAVTSAGAYADELSDLKAQIEALSARVAQVEAAPAAVPAGYQLLSITEVDAYQVPGLDPNDTKEWKYGPKATQIGILPAADAPATTTVEWSGYVRAGVRSWDGPGVDTEDGDDLDVLARGQLKVVGKTDTAVGEVGVRIQLRVNTDGRGDDLFSSNEHWGYWAMTPELTLGGGYTGSLGNIGYGYDGGCTCHYTDNASVGMNPGDTTQIRLSYNSGPLSMAIALEDSTREYEFNDGLGVAGEVKYTGDMFSGEVSAIWLDPGDIDSHDAYTAIGIGGAITPVDMLTITAGVQRVEDHHDEDDRWVASILGLIRLSDEFRLEVAYGHRDEDDGPTQDAFLAGIYYQPVSQLTLGLEAEYFDWSDVDSNTIFDAVAVFAF